MPFGWLMYISDGLSRGWNPNESFAGLMSGAATGGPRGRPGFVPLTPSLEYLDARGAVQAAPPPSAAGGAGGVGEAAAGSRAPTPLSLDQEIASGSASSNAGRVPRQAAASPATQHILALRNAVLKRGKSQSPPPSRPQSRDSLAALAQEQQQQQQQQLSQSSLQSQQHLSLARPSPVPFRGSELDQSPYPGGQQQGQPFPGGYPQGQGGQGQVPMGEGDYFIGGLESDAGTSVDGDDEFDDDYYDDGYDDDERGGGGGYRRGGGGDGGAGLDRLSTDRRHETKKKAVADLPLPTDYYGAIQRLQKNAKLREAARWVDTHTCVFVL